MLIKKRVFKGGVVWVTFLNIIGTVRNILQGESGGLGRKWSIFVEQNCMGKLVEENWGIEQKWSRLVQKYSWGGL